MLRNLGQQIGFAAKHREFAYANPSLLPPQKTFYILVRDIVILVPSRHEKERVACAAKGKRMQAFFCLCGQADGKTLCVSPSQNDAKFSKTRYEKVWSSFSKLADQGQSPCRPPQWAKLSYKSKFEIQIDVCRILFVPLSFQG